MEPSFNFWDKMAKNYPHYDDPIMGQDVKYVLDWCESKGINYRDASVLDIGCGTGTVAIPLAQRGAKITALDLSLGMLAILNEDAKETGYKDHIITHQSDWESFEVPRTHDIVVASITPAISTKAHVDKMLAATHESGIYVGWGKYKKNRLLDALMLTHNATDKNSAGCIKTAQFIALLEERNIPLESHYFTTSWQDTYSYEEAKEFAYDQLKRKELTPDAQKIDAILHDFMQNDTVVVETDAEKGIVLFSTSNVLKHYGCCPKCY